MTSKTIPTDERVSDAQLAEYCLFGARGKFVYIDSSAFKSIACELQSLRSQPTREAVIERSMGDLLLVRADLLAISILGSGECRGLAKDSVKTLDAAIRSLKLPTPEGGSNG